MRDKFFKGERPQIYLQPVVPRLTKDGRTVRVPFTVTMSESLAKTCSRAILGAYEECADPNQQRSQITLTSKFDNTNIALLELQDQADPLFTLRNVRLENFTVNRKEGQVYLSFSCELPMLAQEGLWRFLGERFATTLWAEFTASQFALEMTAVDAAQQLNNRLAQDGATASLIGPQGEVIAKFGAKGDTPKKPGGKK